MFFCGLLKIFGRKIDKSIRKDLRGKYSQTPLDHAT